MISKKYLDDYKLDIETDKKGKVTKNYQYAGDYYKFDVPVEKEKSLKIHLLLYIVGMFLVFIVPLLIYSTLTRVVYVVLPYIVLLVPIFLLGKAIYYLYRNNGNLKREEKEKTFERLKGMPIFMLFLLLLEAVGQIIAYGKWGQEIGVGDYILSGATFILAVLALLFFTKMKNIKVKTIKNEKIGISQETA